MLSQWHLQIQIQVGKPTNVSRRRYSVSDPGIPTESTRTIAMTFSAALDDAFLMSDTLDHLSEEISRK
jgi:hypothetical protein